MEKAKVLGTYFQVLTTLVSSSRPTSDLIMDYLIWVVRLQSEARILGVQEGLLTTKVPNLLEVQERLVLAFRQAVNG
jgi:hypothetical protein